VLLPYSILNPTAGMPPPVGCQVRDYGQVIDRAAALGMGVIVLRVLEAGALTGQATRHPLSDASSEGTPEYSRNVARAAALSFLLEATGGTMAQAAIRFALARPEVSTVLVGFSDVTHLDEAAACSDGRALSPPVLARIHDLYRTDFGLNAAPA